MKNTTKKFLSFALASTLVAGVPVAEAHAECTNGTTIETSNESITYYVVKDGDTLGKIAQNFYGEAGLWEQLATFNQLRYPSKLSIGQVIAVPRDLTVLYGCVYVPYNETQTVVVETPQPVVVVPQCEDDSTYTVKNGDTMYCIVRVLYNLTSQEAVDKLATYNNLADPNRIVEGQVLRIPSYERLMAVKQNDYTEEYNRMGWILNHQQDECEAEIIWVDPCHPWYPMPPKPGCPHYEGHEHGPCLKLRP